MSQSPVPSRPEMTDRRLSGLLAVLCVGAIASILDSTIVNVALDHLSGVFGATIQSTQWLMTGFLLAMAAASPLSGWLLSRFGGRAAWLGALGLFLLGSVLCGAAHTLQQLVAFRILQGLGAGLILPVLMAVMAQAAGKQRLLHAMGIFTVLVQVGPMVGPVAGSFLIRYADWRWLFLANIPLCALGMIGAVLIPAGRPSAPARRLDLVGLVLLSIGTMSLLYGFGAIDPAHVAFAFGWVAPVLVGMGLLSSFVVWAFRRRDQALIDLRLFRDRDFSVASILAILAGFVSFGGLLLIPLYLEQVLGANIIRAGLYLIAQGLGTALLVLAAKRPLQRISGRTRILAGFAVMALATVPFCLPNSRHQIGPLLAALLLRGVGIGLAVPVINHIALATLPPQRVADGSNAFNIIQRLGAPLGTTILSITLARSLSETDSVARAAHAYAAPFLLATALTALPALMSFALSKPAPRDGESNAHNRGPGL